MNTRKVRGFTLIELLVVIAIIALLIGILLPALASARRSAQQLKDSTQIRGAHQGLVLWAQDNRDDYPLPSRLDINDRTILVNMVGERDREKDITGQILSAMIQTGSVTTELFVSPAEQNPGIEEYENYQIDEPDGAPNNGEQALWDPKFRGTPDAVEGDTLNIFYGTNDGTGNTSYAHTLPFGRQTARWTNTTSASEAIFANRGPVYTASGTGENLIWDLMDDAFGLRSNTMLIHGGRVTWEGNVAYNDNHVTFESSPTPDGAAQIQVTATTGGGQAFVRNDNIFQAENDLNGNDNPLADGQAIIEIDNPANLGATPNTRVFGNRNAFLQVCASVEEDADSISIWKD